MSATCIAVFADYQEMSEIWKTICVNLILQSKTMDFTETGHCHIMSDQ